LSRRRGRSRRRRSGWRCLLRRRRLLVVARRRLLRGLRVARHATVGSGEESGQKEKYAVLHWGESSTAGAAWKALVAPILLHTASYAAGPVDIPSVLPLPCRAQAPPEHGIGEGSAGPQPPSAVQRLSGSKQDRRRRGRTRAGTPAEVSLRDVAQNGPVRVPQPSKMSSLPAPKVLVGADHDARGPRRLVVATIRRLCAIGFTCCSARSATAVFGGVHNASRSRTS
jgi:hypothetical protein